MHSRASDACLQGRMVRRLTRAVCTAALAAAAGLAAAAVAVMRTACAASGARRRGANSDVRAALGNGQTEDRERQRQRQTAQQTAGRRSKPACLLIVLVRTYLALAIDAIDIVCNCVSRVG
jgi:hypothetical protein